MASASPLASLPAAMQLLSEARRFGIAHAYQVEASDGAREVVRVQLAATSRYVAQERDVDIACTIAVTPEAWLTEQEVNGYKFHDLQFAKFSSMMLVYHIIKGWKKDFTAPPRQTAVPSSSAAAPHRLHANMEEEEDDDDEARLTTPSTASPMESPELTPAFYHTHPQVVPPIHSQFAPVHSQFAPSVQRFQLVSECSEGMEHEVHALHAVTDSHRQATLQVEHVPYDYKRQQQVYEDHTLKHTSTAAPADSAAQLPMHSPHAGAGGTVTEEEDTFWTDASFFQEFEERPAADENPFWDCFFSTLT